MFPAMPDDSDLLTLALAVLQEAAERSRHEQVAGTAVRLALRTLMRAAPAWQVAARDVYVCENPNLVAIAADALGEYCAPLVCTDGMPAAAQRILLAQLAGAGAREHDESRPAGYEGVALAVMRALAGRYGDHNVRIVAWSTERRRRRSAVR